MKVYYNEFDANAAQWLRNLGEAGQIAKGEVDERSIKEVKGADLAGVRRAHFFAGIGGWDYALRLAGWPEDREVWTGSCPCQPFSSAGKGKGVEDERHLWPEFFRLIAECRPGVVFGEQVGSKAGLGWLDGVFTDLENAGYTCGAVIVGAHSVGAPHIRQRIFWGATLGRLAQDPASLGRGRGRDGNPAGDDGQVQTEGLRAVGGVAFPTSAERGEGGDAARNEGGSQPQLTGSGPWSDFRLVLCTDGKARRTGARVFPLAHGLPRGVGDGGSWRKGLARCAGRSRVGMLKGSGNAIVPDLAAEFIRAFLDTQEGQ